MKKKIVFYTMALVRGGTERTIVNLANEFACKYDVVIITNILKESDYELDKKIKHISLDEIDKYPEKLPQKIVTKLSLKRTKKLKEILKQEQPNLVLCFLPEPTIRMLSIKKDFNNLKVIVAIRNHPNSEFPCLKKVRDYYYKRADGIIIQDKAYQKYLKNSKNIYTIPNFLSNEFINCEQKNKKSNKIVSVGRLENQKNYKLLIKAFANLRPKLNNYKLYIYGEGKKRKSLEKLIGKLKLNDKVFLKGNVSDVAKKISDAKVFVLSSNYEGMPNALLEAMSLSLPVITTNSTEVITNIITNYHNGIIIPRKNNQELTKTLNEILLDQKLQEKLSKEASKVKKIYQKEKIIKLWYEIIAKNTM